jgi:hypothetical protein
MIERPLDPMADSEPIDNSGQISICKSPSPSLFTDARDEKRSESNRGKPGQIERREKKNQEAG